MEKFKNRSKFNQLALANPKAAAEQLRLKALGLENCKNPASILRALSSILFLSERTIERDWVREIYDTVS